MNRDLAFGAAGMVVASGYYWRAAGIPDSALADTVGPQGLPMTYAVVLLCLSTLLVGRALRTKLLEPKTPDPGPRIPAPGSPIPDPRPRFPLARVAGMLAFGAVYIVVVPWIGYTAALAGLLFAVTWYLGGSTSRSVAVVAVSGALVFWLIFVQLLGIPHPAGAWVRLF